MLDNSVYNLSDFFEEVCNPYNVKNYPYSKGLMLKKWDDSVLDYISSNNVDSIFINVSCGWSGGSDFSFLENLTKIKELNILVGESKNIASIEQMISLETLEITANAKEVIDFTKLKKMKKCFLSWWPKATKILELESIEELYLDNLKIKDYSGFKISSDLTKLTLGNSNINNLSFLERMGGLKELNLLNCKKVEDFSYIGLCTKLQKLDLSGCRLIDLNFLRNLEDLQVLLIADVGNIENIKILSNLKKLKAIWFAGNTIVNDGDLNPLTNLPSLAMVNFNNRRHYSHRLNKEWNWNDFDTPDSNLIVFKS